MAEASTECANCGAPVTAADATCRFCGHVRKGVGVAGSKPPMPAELRSAIERLRQHQGSPATLLDHLAAVLSQLLPRSAVKTSGSVRGAKRLDVVIGTMAYTFQLEGPTFTVERQSIAGGFMVGMKDRLPASRWPEQLVVDLANHADDSGQDWKAAVARI